MLVFLASIYARLPRLHSALASARSNPSVPIVYRVSRHSLVNTHSFLVRGGAKCSSAFIGALLRCLSTESQLVSLPPVRIPLYPHTNKASRHSFAVAHSFLALGSAECSLARIHRRTLRFCPAEQKLA